MRLPRKILIIRLGALGDIVHTLPTLKPMRERIPDAYIAWMVEDTWAGLLEEHPLIDKVIAIPKKQWRHGLLRPWQWPKTFAEILLKRRKVVANQFDIAIDFQGNLKSGSIAVLCGAHERLGYAYSDSRELNPLFMSRRVKIKENRIHRSEKCLELLRAVIGDCSYSRPHLPTSAEDEKFAREFTARIAKRPIIAIHPATSSFGVVKRWPLTSFAAVGDALSRKHNAAILITWGPREKGMAEELARTMREPAIVSAQTKRLGQLVALLRQCDLFIGADTGPLHIASAIGKPVVAIFGPKDPAIYGPREQPNRIVQADVPCRPCARRKCDDAVCMKLILPETVLAAAEDLLPKTQ